MSYTELYAFGKDGEIYFYDKVHNSHRGAQLFWMKMEEKYLPPFRPSYVPSHIEDDEIETYLRFKPTRMGDTEAMSEVWNLVLSSKITDDERIMMTSTFDRVAVKKENFVEVANAFLNDDKDTTLKEQAEIILRMSEDENIIALAWNQTSVNLCLWEDLYALRNPDFDEEADDEYEKIRSIPYNILKCDDVHFWLMEHVSEIISEIKEG